MRAAWFISATLSLALAVVQVEVDQPTTHISGGTCSNAFVRTLEWLWGTSSLQGTAEKLLSKVQSECASSKCPRIGISRTCKNQSIDDVNCEMKDIFSTSLKLGTDDICDTGCDDWPCKAGCKGIDTGICYGSDWVLCKAGCLGISSCMHKCEHAIVDPCKDKLINQCSQKCEDAFQKCKVACESKLTMHISGDLERLQNMVTSMNVSTLDANCTGNGITSAFSFQAKTAININNVAISLKVRLSDVGVSTNNDADLKKVSMFIAVPLSGYVDCGLTVHNITVKVGEATVTGMDMNVDLQLDKTLDTISAVVCADLPFCKDAIKEKISSTIKGEIMKQVPSQVASQLQPVLQELANELHCPKLSRTHEAESEAAVVV